MDARGGPCGPQSSFGRLQRCHRTCLPNDNERFSEPPAGNGGEAGGPPPPPRGARPPSPSPPIVARALTVALATYGATVRAERVQLEESVEATLARAATSLEETRARQRAATQAERAAFQAFDRGAKDAGAAWDEARERRAAVMPALDNAQSLLESALLLDASRQDVRQRFAELLLLRATEAEERFDRSKRDRFLKRAALYAPSAPGLADFRRTSRICFETEPAGASIALEQSRDGRFHERPHADPHDPCRALSEGSYRAVLRHEGHQTTFLPFEVRRPRDRVLRVRIPSQREIPRGFAYVPGGKGWYGSGAEESLREGFFHAEPLHQVHVPAFLIAQHETTFATWLEFVRSLPRDERAAMLPRVESGGFQGSLRVAEGDDGRFRLFLRAGDRPHRAREGEALVIAARSTRSRLDWGRLPVTGVSAVQAVAFARWLDRTGRVPGARLCNEHEWERAARGADRRTYPHGEALAPSEANIDTTYGKNPEAMAPDEVGVHVASSSPFGIADMAGNAWEWTRDAHDPPAFVARGGSFSYDAQVARIENRETPEPTFRDVSVGVRICADAPRGSGAARRVGALIRRVMRPW